MKRVFITGVSSGIGEALAKLYLSLDYEVYGVSRRAPRELLTHNRFFFKTFDLASSNAIHTIFTDDFEVLKTHGVDIVFLNAGQSGDVPKKGVDFSNQEIEQVYAVNVMANKSLLDFFLGQTQRPTMFVLSASMAGVRYREGTLPYSMSKAALAAMAGVYAQEFPDIFFAVLGLCNVNSSLSRQVSFSERTREFPALHALQQRALSVGYMVSPAQRAQDIVNVINNKEDFDLQSGLFVDIRTLLQSAPASVVADSKEVEHAQ